MAESYRSSRHPSTKVPSPGNSVSMGRLSSPNNNSLCHPQSSIQHRTWAYSRERLYWEACRLALKITLLGRVSCTQLSREKGAWLTAPTGTCRLTERSFRAFQLPLWCSLCESKPLIQMVSSCLCEERALNNETNSKSAKVLPEQHANVYILNKVSAISSTGQ